MKKSLKSATGKRRSLKSVAYSERELLFVAAYQGNGTEAAIKAGYSPHTARIIASQLLAKEKIQKAIEMKAQRQVEIAAAVGVAQTLTLINALRDHGVDERYVAQRTRAILDGKNLKSQVVLLKEMYRLFGPSAARGAVDDTYAPAGMVFDYKASWVLEREKQRRLNNGGTDRPPTTSD